jgi:hypothetical protein
MIKNILEKLGLMRKTSFNVLQKDNSFTSVDLEKRMIVGVAVISTGEALGHDLFIDTDFLNDVIVEGNSYPKGVKVNFNHEDDLGQYLGRMSNFRLDNNVVRADLTFSMAASKSPEGDLPSYLLDLALEDPSSFGASICFERDCEAENDFISNNSSKGVFQTPDKFNVSNLPHACLGRLLGCDLVSSPACNPAGLFSSKNVDNQPIQEEEKMEKPLSELERFNALNVKFGSNPKFVIDQFKSGNDVEAAELAFKDARIAELESELLKLKGASGAAPAQFQPESVVKGFKELVNETMLSRKLSKVDAIRYCARQYPNEHANYVNSNGKK